MKYNKNAIYAGTLMQYKNNKNIILKENVFLAYSEEEDCFYDLTETLNPSLDLLNPNLTKEQVEKIQDSMNKHKYPYTNSESEGNMYIDEKTIKVIVDSKKIKANRG